MRRNDREVTDLDEQIAIIQRCDVCRLAFFDAESPYIVPMNFGFEQSGDTLSLYFHSARTGKKLDCLAANPRVSFEMDGAHRLLEADLACGYSMEYESVIGHGTARLVTDAQKRHALECIMQHYRPDDAYSFDPRMVEAVAVFQVTVQAMTAKRLKK